MPQRRGWPAVASDVSSAVRIAVEKAVMRSVGIGRAYGTGLLAWRY